MDGAKKITLVCDLADIQGQLTGLLNILSDDGYIKKEILEVIIEKARDQVEEVKEEIALETNVYLYKV